MGIIKSGWKEVVDFYYKFAQNRGLDPVELLLGIVMGIVILFIVQYFIRGSIFKLVFKVMMIAGIIGGIYWGYLNYASQNIIQNAGERIGSPKDILKATKKIIDQAGKSEQDKLKELEALEEENPQNY